MKHHLRTVKPLRRPSILLTSFLLCAIAIPCWAQSPAQDQPRQDQTAQDPGGQDKTAKPPAQDQNQNQNEAKPETPERVLDLASPRAVLRTLLNAVDEAEKEPARIADAVACLDLSALEEADRKEQATLRARQIVDAIDKYYPGGVPLDTVPEAGKDASGTYQLFALDRHAVILARKADGNWCFSAQTVKDAPLLLAAIQKTAKEEPPEQVPDNVPPEHRSARATMQTFLDAMNAGKRDIAAKCLDLGALDAATRDETGRTLADMLKDTMDRLKIVVLREISDKPVDDPYEFYSDTNGHITIARRESGEWLFTASSVATIEALHKAHENKPILDALRSSSPSFWTSPARWIRHRVPAELKVQVFLMPHWQWIGLAALFLLSYAVGWLFYRLCDALARRWLTLEHVTLSPEVRARALKPTSRFVLVLVFWLGLDLLSLGTELLIPLLWFVKFIIPVLGVWGFYRLVDLISGYLQGRAEQTASRMDDLILPLVQRSLKVIIVVGGAVLLVDIFAPSQINRLLAGLGIGGLAVALAAQDIVKNIFGSIMVIMEQPFQVGDSVKIGDVEGTVETVGFRSTRVRTFYNSRVTLPNSNLLNTAVDNLGARQFRRFKCFLSVTYSTTPEQLDAFCAGIRELIDLAPHTRKDFYVVSVNVFAASSIDILLYCFHEVPDFQSEVRERHRLMLDIIRLAQRLGVEFAFPTQTLYTHQVPPEENSQIPESLRTEDPLRIGRAEAKRIAAGEPFESTPPGPDRADGGA